jgi:hypothetical protein
MSTTVASTVMATLMVAVAMTAGHHRQSPNGGRGDS